MQPCIVIYMTGGQPTETTSNEEQELQYYYLFFMLLFLSSMSCNVLNYTFPVMGISNANSYITYLDKISFWYASIYWINYILSISNCEKELAYSEITDIQDKIFVYFSKIAQSLYHFKFLYHISADLCYNK